MDRRKVYKETKAASIGSLVVCAGCGEIFTKKTSQQAFCTQKGGTVCKDKYWNTVTPTKRNNTTRISPASRAFMQLRREQREERAYMGDYDPGDSEYWDNKDY